MTAVEKGRTEQGGDRDEPSGVVAVVTAAGGVSAGERRRRQQAVEESRHSVEMEGGRVSAAAEADAARYVAGELSSEDLLERVRRRVARARAAAAAGG